jgi:hypothetical protein
MRTPRAILSMCAVLRDASLIAGAVLSAVTANAETISTWNGTNGNWSTASNWSSNPFYPDNGNGASDYTAVIGAGSVNLDVGVTLFGLVLGGGSLDGSQDMSVDNATLNSGTLGTTGILSSPHVVLNGGTLARNLTLSAGNHAIGNATIGAGFTLGNAVGSTLVATAGPGEKESLGPGTIINQGTFIKDGNARFYLSLPFDNQGSVEVQQSSLRMGAAGTHSGAFDVWTGSQLELGGTQTFMPGATIAGAGGLRIMGGTTTIDSEVATDFLWLSGGTLAGSGNLHPTQFNFTGGTIGRNLALPAGNHTIENAAIGSGFVLTNPVGSTLTATTGPGEREGLGPGTLANLGTFVKTGNARYYASMPMNNDGLVQVQQNNLRMGAGGTHTGQFDVWTDAQLELTGAHTFTPSATISGDGGVRIMGGTSTINSLVTTDFVWASGGTLSGEGMIAALVLLSPGSRVAPGTGPGAMFFSDELIIENGSQYAWQLTDLTTANPGIDWDQLVMTDGELALAAGAVLDLEFIDSASAPDSGAPFWTSPRRWNNIVDLTGTATNPSAFVEFVIDNSPWVDFGTFDTQAAQFGDGIDLVWNPVPEPATWLLFVTAAAAMMIAKSRTVRRPKVSAGGASLAKH